MEPQKAVIVKAVLRVRPQLIYCSAALTKTGIPIDGKTNAIEPRMQN